MSEWETVSKSTNDEWETISSDWETVSPSSQQQEQSGVQPTPLDYALNPSTLNTVVASKLSGLLGQDEIAKQLEEKATQQATKSANTSWTQAASDLSTAGLDTMAGVVGMPVGIAAGVGSTLLNGPQKGLQTAKEVMGKLTYSNLAGTQEQVSQSPAYNAAMLPFAALTAGMETAGKGYGELTKELGGDEELAKNVAALTELGLLTGTGAGSLHGIYKGTKGAIQAVKDIKEATKSSEQKPALEPSNELFAEDGLKLTESRITNIQNQITEMMDNGIDVKRDTPILEARAAELEQLRQQKADFEGMLRGETKQEALDRAERQIQKLQELRASKPQTYDVGSEITPEQLHTQRLNQLNEDVAIRQAQDQGPTIPEAIQDPTGYVNKVAAEQAVPKTTPQEVALTKIGEAMNMERGELGDRILDTQDKLDAIPDTPENSSSTKILSCNCYIF